MGCAQEQEVHEDAVRVREEAPLGMIRIHWAAIRPELEDKS